MSKERFLLWMLAGIFTFQAGTFAYGFYKCSSVAPIDNIKEVCPMLGERYENTFTTMTAVVLALLTGSVIKDR